MADLTLRHDGIVHETIKAILFDFDGKEVWLPKSEITTHNGTIVEVPQWLAEDKGLEAYMEE